MDASDFDITGAWGSGLGIEDVGSAVVGEDFGDWGTIAVAAMVGVASLLLL